LETKGKFGDNPSSRTQFCRVAESQRTNVSISCSYQVNKTPPNEIKTISGGLGSVGEMVQTPPKIMPCPCPCQAAVMVLE
jgi:hypothetical protein